MYMKGKGGKGNGNTSGGYTWGWNQKKGEGGKKGDGKGKGDAKGKGKDFKDVVGFVENWATRSANAPRTYVKKGAFF